MIAGDMQLLSVESHAQYDTFRYGGEISLPALVEALGRVNSHCQANALKGALVDVSGAVGTLSGIERFEAARILAPTWARDVSLAIVTTAEQRAPGRVGQLFAQNRGVRVQVFTDPLAAVAWIEKALRDRPGAESTADG